MTTFAGNALTFTRDLLTGFAELLAADTGSPFAWSDTADYTAGQLGLWLGDLPADTDRGVALMTYPLAAAPVQSTATTGVQFLSRGARGAGVFDAMGLDDAMQNALGGRFPILLPTGVYVASLVWTSGAPLGVDELSRWSVSSNFTATVRRPGAHRS